MEIKFIHKDKEKAVFVLKGITPAHANAIRRTIVDDVPTLAIEDVELRKNSSVLYDEIIAHRLGLIPFVTDLKSYNLPSECTCKGEFCAKCSVQVSLKSKPAQNDEIIFADAIKSKDPKAIPSYPKTPIVKLLKGQDLEFEALAVLGTGKEHTKWSPAHAFYRYYPVIDIKGAVDDAEKVKKSCPVNVFEVINGKLSVKDLEACTLCGACADVTDSIKLGEKNDEFIFFIESFGQLEPKEIVEKAVEILDKNLNSFTESLK